MEKGDDSSPYFFKITSSTPETETEEFYNQTELIYEPEKEYYTIIFGDWNAKINADSPVRRRANIAEIKLIKM